MWQRDCRNKGQQWSNSQMFIFFQTRIWRCRFGSRRRRRRRRRNQGCRGGQRPSRPRGWRLRSRRRRWIRQAKANRKFWCNRARFLIMKSFSFSHSLDNINSVAICTYFQIVSKPKSYLSLTLIHKKITVYRAHFIDRRFSMLRFWSSFSDRLTVYCLQYTFTWY